MVEFDQICLLLMGAVDVSAHVANTALSLLEAPTRTKWQYSGWRQQVFDAHQPLVEVLCLDNDWNRLQDGGQVLSILLALRNTIHGEALMSLSFHRTGKPKETFVGLPSDQRERLLTNVRALGGDDSWGIQEFGPDRLLANPGMLIEQLFPRIVCLLNDLMRETPVERLDGANLGPGDHSPPKESPFDSASRQRILWQLGL